MNSIYTSKGTLVVEQTIWSGVARYVKNTDGTYEEFYRIHGQTKFRKTGWGAKAKKEFDIAFNQVQQETR